MAKMPEWVKWDSMYMTYKDRFWKVRLMYLLQGRPPEHMERLYRFFSDRYYE